LPVGLALALEGVRLAPGHRVQLRLLEVHQAHVLHRSLLTDGTAVTGAHPTERRASASNPSTRSVWASSAIGRTSTHPIHAPGILEATWIASFRSSGSWTCSPPTRS